MIYDGQHTVTRYYFALHTNNMCDFAAGGRMSHENIRPVLCSLNTALLCAVWTYCMCLEQKQLLTDSSVNQQKQNHQLF